MSFRWALNGRLRRYAACCAPSRARPQSYPHEHRCNKGESRQPPALWLLLAIGQDRWHIAVREYCSERTLRQDDPGIKRSGKARDAGGLDRETANASKAYR